jgi:hypothetical protein
MLPSSFFHFKPHTQKPLGGSINNIFIQFHPRILTPDGSIRWFYFIEKSQVGSLCGQIFILYFAYISRKFHSDPRHFPLKTKKYLHHHPADSYWNISILRKLVNRNFQKAVRQGAQFFSRYIFREHF